MSYLYDLLIGPIELIFEFIFSIANKLINNPGLSIVFLSLTMNFLVLPLYKRADAMQAEQRQTEQKLKPWVNHIKKTFKGDERYMVLQTYYRQNNYKPTDTLKGTISLLLQIPFFIAAYNMLSNLQLLEGMGFGLIKDLSAPDGLLVIDSLAINILPIIMTTINIISGIVYSKGMSASSKIQMFGMAGIFLILLYNSPSGLVFYWTLNNVFSLCKNLFAKLKNPNLAISILSSVGSFAILGYFIFNTPRSIRLKLIFIFIILALQVPIAIYLISKKHNFSNNIVISKQEKITFIICCVFMAILTGALVPSSVISSSPQEFIDIVALNNPTTYIFHSLCIATGLFVIWGLIFYTLFSNKGKRIMGCVMAMGVGIALADYMLFGKDYGILTPKLGYAVTTLPNLKSQLINIAVILIIAAILLLIYLKKINIMQFGAIVLCLAITGMSTINTVKIESNISQCIQNIKENEKDSELSLPLSKNGQNVIVIMMDKAIGCYLPYILQEKPELKGKLNGFTFYPNTISYGGFTNFGSPGLYGGYDYTPENMNKRKDQPLVEKHNEALQVMPKLFSQAGYNVTVADPTYAGYKLVPDLSIYDGYENVNAFNLMGRTQPKEVANNNISKDLLNRNFFCYSLFRIAPTALQPYIYHHGSYNRPDSLFYYGEGLPPLSAANNQVRDSLTTASGFSHSFLRPYYSLCSYPDITKITDDAKSSFIMMSNDTTHELALLQTPEYKPVNKVDNTEYFKAHRDDYVIDGKELHMDNQTQVASYHINVAALNGLINWFEYLKANGVYDNTKIIVVADHGAHFEQYDGLPMKYGAVLMGYNPMLLVKDFGNSQRELVVDNSFMTNADVPSIATKDIINDAKNPFTNNPLDGSNYKQGEQHICLSNEWSVYTNNKNEFKASDWLSVHDDIYNLNNWSVYNYQSE